MTEHRVLRSLPPLPASRWFLLGQLVAATGVLVQWAAAPQLYTGIPAGLLYLLGAALIGRLGRRSPWAPAAGLLLVLLLVATGLGSGDLGRDLGSANPALVAGTLVLLAGLLVSVAAGASAIAAARRRAPRPLVRPLARANPNRKPIAFTAFGLCAAATADAFGQGLHWDHPSALVLPLLAVGLLTVPGRYVTLLAAVVSAVYLCGAVTDDLTFHRLTSPTPGGLVFVIMQLAGYTANLGSAVKMATATAGPVRPRPDEVPEALAA